MAKCQTSPVDQKASPKDAADLFSKSNSDDSDGPSATPSKSHHRHLSNHPYRVLSSESESDTESESSLPPTLQDDKKAVKRELENTSPSKDLDCEFNATKIDIKRYSAFEL